MGIVTSLKRRRSCHRKICLRGRTRRSGRYSRHLVRSRHQPLLDRAPSTTRPFLLLYLVGNVAGWVALANPTLSS
jgi:hypothetical protein